MEKYKWKWMVLGALGCINNVDFQEKILNDNIVLDVFIICQKLRDIVAKKCIYEKNIILVEYELV